MKITYQLTPRDFRDATNLNKIRKIVLVLVLFFVVTAVVSGLPFMTEADKRELLWKNLFPFVGVVAFWFALLWVLPWWNSKKILKGMPSAQAPIVFEATDLGIRMQTQNGTSETAWAAFPKWTERKSIFLLYTSPYVFNLIPKRAFAAGEEDEFRKLLTAKIAKK